MKTRILLQLLLSAFDVVHMIPLYMASACSSEDDEQFGIMKEYAWLLWSFFNNTSSPVLQRSVNWDGWSFFNRHPTWIFLKGAWSSWAAAACFTKYAAEEETEGLLALLYLILPALFNIMFRSRFFFPKKVDQPWHLHIQPYRLDPIDNIKRFARHKMNSSFMSTTAAIQGKFREQMNVISSREEYLKYDNSKFWQNSITFHGNSFQIKNAKIRDSIVCNGVTTR